MACDESLVGITCAVARIAGASVGAAVAASAKLSRLLTGTPASEAPCEPQPSSQKPCPATAGEAAGSVSEGAAMVVSAAAEPEPLTYPEVTSEDVDHAPFRSKAARTRFQKALADLAAEDVKVRAEAAAKLSKIPGELSVRALTAQYLREPHGRVRQKCIAALATLGMREGLPAAERALEDKAAAVRLAAVRAVYELAGADAVELLARVRSDPNESVRRRSRKLGDQARQRDSASEAGAASD